MIRSYFGLTDNPFALRDIELLPFSCGENFNNIDLMIIQGHDFMPAVDVLKGWLEEYRRDLGRNSSPAQSVAQ